MDIKRITLFAVFAITSYLMLQTWNQDYGQVKQTTSSRITSATVSDLPMAVESTSDVPSDLPTVTAQDQSEITSLVTETNPEGYISVKTDVLDLQINLQGGDIEYLALPAYPLTLETPNDPFVMLENSSVREFIAQSGLVGKNGIDSKSRPVFKTTSDSFELTGDQLEVVLSYSQDAVEYEKIFTFKKGDYLIGVEYRIDNRSTSDWNGALFGQLKRDKTVDPSSSGGIGMSSALAFARTTEDTRYEKIQFGDIEDGIANYSNQGGWIAFIQHYYVSAWVPVKDQLNNYYLKTTSDGQYRGGYTSETFNVAAGNTGSISASLFVGPKDQKRLSEVAENLDLSIDYGWLWWAAQPIFWLLTTIQGFVVNWGWSIILLTLCIKAAFYPLTAASARSMARMRKFSPRMQQLREQFGDDRQRMSQELMKLYKKEKINPMGGCLPILIQMPVFIALYWVLMEAVELRQSPWIFWIYDLSQKDPYFILPILMSASMALQMRLTAQPNMEPMQAKMMKMMPWVFGVMFLWFPSGLVLYWLVNNLISISQQWYINRQIERGEDKPA